jgi:RecA/RadA recombinase
MDTPGPGLQVGGDVLGQVVVGDNNLVVRVEGSSVSPRSGPPPPTPRRRPVRPATPRTGVEPMGRDTELGAIGGWLDRRLPVEIYGEPGIGKTTLLRRVAADRGSALDVVYLSASGFGRNDLLQEVFQAFYDVEGYQPEPPRMRRLLGSVQALLVLDDITGSPDDLTAVLDAVPSCDVLLAGDERHLFGDGQAIHLRGLTESDARAVLTRHLGRRLTSDESDAATRVWEAAQGNPRVLVQTAAALRRLWEEPAGDLPRLSLDVAEPALAPVLASRLGGDAMRLLAALCAVGEGVPVSRPALAAMSGGAGAEAALTPLLATGLVEEVGAGYRLAGSLGGAVAGHAGDLPAATDLAAVLTRWTAAAAPRDVAQATPAIIRVLELLTSDGELAAAVALARAAAPRLALSLHFDAWSQVLARGRAAARSARAVADEAYFAGEEETRRRLLAMAVVAGAGGATAGTLGAAHLHPPSTQGAAPPAGPHPPNPPSAGQPAPPARPRRTLPRRVLTHPATMVVVVTAVVTAVVTGTVGALRGGLAARDTPTVQEAPPVTTPAAAPTEPPLLPAEEPTPPTASTPAPSMTAPASSPSAVPCVPGGAPLDFGSVAVGSRSELAYPFYSHECHTQGLDTAHMTIRGPGATAFSLTRSACPDVILPGGETCHLTITFAPPATGPFDAVLFIPEAGGGRGHGESRLVGVGSPPAALTTPPTAPPTPSPSWSTPPRTAEPPTHAPVITAVNTYREGALVYLSVRYADADGDAEGFGFRGVNGSGWAPESFPFSSPSYGRASPGRIDYPFNHRCGQGSEVESDVEFWIYDSGGRRSTPVVTHLSCS